MKINLVVLAAVVGVFALGCPEKKTEPLPPPPKPAEPVKPPPPPPEAQPRADRECAAPLDPGPVTDVKIADRDAKASGSKLTFTDKDADGALVLGVLGPINEDSGQNVLAMKKYLKFFSDEKADAIVVTGDVGEVADGIARVLKQIAESKLPVFAVIGNRECRAEFTDGVDAARKEHNGVVNLNAYRVIELPGATLVSLPGYHEPNYMGCAKSCRYFKSTVDEVVAAAKESKNPVVLVSHGPPHGVNNQALDAASGGDNAGDPEINRAIKEANIAFGLFSNIKEAGGRASADASGESLVKENTPSKTLFYNPGPADTMGWGMNDGTTSYGMAGVISIKDGQASWKGYRAKAPTAAEKAEAKKLEPPPREKGEAPAPAPAPEAAPAAPEQKK